MSDVRVSLPVARDQGRPIRQRDRTRTFRPNYLSFAGTFQCNLSCPHCCVPIEWTDRLDIPTAIRFLEQAHSAGIDVLGFTGGEPFLFPEFLVALTRRAAELGFRFDKLMTNGVWFRDETHLEGVLRDLIRAGFSGKIGLSVDKFHGMDIAKLAAFCRTTRRVFQKDTILSLSYASRSPELGHEPIQRLAKELDGTIAWSDMLHRYLLVSDDLTMTMNWNHLAPVERAEKLPGNPWDGVWFEEDYCEGPGQALIVNPRGEVKPCCGFGSDLDELTIGNIYQHTAEEVIRKGREHPYVGKLFREGLTAIRDEVLARDPNALPGATSNHCFFCWYTLSKNLTGLNSGSTRRGLPMSGTTSAANEFLLLFDGQTVFLGTDPAAFDLSRGGRIYRIAVEGPGSLAPPPIRMNWTEYQTWIDAQRALGFTLSTREFPPCQSS